MARNVRSLALTLVALAALLTATLLPSQYALAAQKLQAGDELIIVIPDPKPRKVVVQLDAEGKIKLGIYGEVKIGGLSQKQAELKVRAALGKFLVNTGGVSLVLSEKKRLVLVTGKVAKPGMVRISSTADIWQAIQEAGGVSDGADLRRVVLTREGVEQRIDIRAFLTRESQLPLPELLVGDVIFVPADAVVSGSDAARSVYLSERVLKDKVFVLGAVRNPNLLERSPGLNPLTALALAGGPTSGADLSNVRLLTAEASIRVDIPAHIQDPGLPMPGIPEGSGAILYIPERQKDGDDPFGQHINVVGQVKAPGRVRIRGEVPLIDALGLAGGPTEKGEIDDVRVVRKGFAYTLSAGYDVERYFEEGGVVGMVNVRPGDTVYLADNTDTVWKDIIGVISDIALISASIALFAGLAL